MIDLRSSSHNRIQKDTCCSKIILFNTISLLKILKDLLVKIN